MSDSDLEALATPKIKDALRTAIEKVGEKDFRSLSGLSSDRLQHILERENEYVAVTLVSVACRINKAHGDPDPNHSSVTEALKGSVVRMPGVEGQQHIDQQLARPPHPDMPKPRRAAGPLYDQKSVKLLNFGASTISFLILGYFLGGIGLAPLFGQQSCIGVAFSPPELTPCLGSILGLVIASFAGLGYTYYYFVKRV